MLKPRELVPHFTVTALDGHVVRYADIWHRRFLVLVCVAPDSIDRERLRTYAAELTAACAATDVDTACVVTLTPVEGVPTPGAIVADRYGEIAFVSDGIDGEPVTLPAIADLADWVRYIGIRCS